MQKVTAAIIFFCGILFLGMAPGKSAATKFALDQAGVNGTAVSAAATNLADAESVILKKAREQLEQRFSDGEYRFEVQTRWIPNQLLQLSPDNILALELQGNIKRHTNFKVLYQQRGDRQRTEIQLKVEVEQKLPVVTDRVRRGDELTSGDLIYQWISLSRNSGDYIEDVKTLEGKTLRKTLLSGQPVRKSMISREMIIEAGDEVKVVIERNGVQVQVTGEAREDGALGDQIRIYSNETRKKYEGEVIRPGVIQWKNTL